MKCYAIRRHWLEYIFSSPHPLCETVQLWGCYDDPQKATSQTTPVKVSRCYDRML